MSATAAAADATAQAPQAPVAPAEERALALFARSALDLFDLWPALRLAISHGWGGDGAEGKTALAEDVVDLFYTAATSGGAGAGEGSSSLREQGIALPAADDVAATLLHVVGNEFDVDLEDGSEVLVARDLVALWRECLGRVLSGPPPEAGETLPEGELARRFREGAERARAQDRGGRRFDAQREGGGGDESSGDEYEGSEDDDDDDDDEDERMDGVEGQVPQLVETRPREEPVVDEDGFELVQTKKKGGRR